MLILIVTRRAYALIVSMFFCVMPLHLLAQNVRHPPFIVEQSLKILVGSREDRSESLMAFEQRGKTDVVAVLIQALRFNPQDSQLRATLVKLTGHPDQSWGDWMLWQENNPQIKPFEGFDFVKAKVVTLIDPNFSVFLYPGVRHSIRLEEIAWGGVNKDGIPSLDNPALTSTEGAEYLRDDDLVFGVSINGDTRAYPLRIMNWHEMFNDVIGGVSVALAYCTLCGSGILYETDIGGGKEPIVFGSSGFLYRSNKLMYDKQTHSLWNQFTGRPVVGYLAGSKLELKTRPVTITTWQQWKKHNPNTKVLSIETGFQRDYGSGVAYRKYFSSPELMFPVSVNEDDHAAKSYVFVLRVSGKEKAWPLSDFGKSKVVNDKIDGLSIILVGDEETRTVRAYEGNGEVFSAGNRDVVLISENDTWQLTENELISSSGVKLARLSGHISYWFAWNNYNQAGEFPH